MLTQWTRALNEPLAFFRETAKGWVLGALVLGVIFGLNQFPFSRYFPIQNVKVYGVSHLSPREVQSVLSPLVTHGFFSVNVDGIRDRLMQLPWVADVMVKRLWPNGLEVVVLEKKPVARWNQTSILSDAGDLFEPTDDAAPMSLVDFSGPDGGQVLMLQYFYQIDHTLTPLHVKILSLALTPYMTWKLALDNGMTLQIGHKDILNRLAQFVKVYPKIIGDRADEVDTVDLRYPNGMAVRWKSPVKT